MELNLGQENFAKVAEVNYGVDKKLGCDIMEYMKKNINPTISIVIMLAVFVVSLFIILQGETALNKQLSASIVSGVKMPLDTMEISECLRNEYSTFLSKWNQECKAENLEDKCSLPRDIADPLKADYENSQKSCY